ncbi:MAG TPA: carbohydrate kinase [Clostridiaceae bacterium]|nr:carbohydrate kinase [Clostridiaceae bacterium]
MDMQKKYDIVAIGECLIDFVPSPMQEEGKLNFSGCPGGAPANVLACASKLGLNTAFIGKVGNDVFGQLLYSTLSDCGINTSSLVISDKYPTTLAFVALDKNGDRVFSFYRNQTADCMITPDEIDSSLLSDTKVFHFGSVSMTTEPARGTTLYAVKKAKEHGALISYDPNLRELLWDSLFEAKEVISSAMKYCDIVKVSEEELYFLTGVDDVDNALLQLFKQNSSIKVLVVTMGSKGCKATYGQNILTSAGFDVKTVDTVGAGDTFWGAFLYQILSGNFDPCNPDERSLSKALTFSNAAGALSTTKNGAIPAMPMLDDILSLIKQHSV